MRSNIALFFAENDELAAGDAILPDQLLTVNGTIKNTSGTEFYGVRIVSMFKAKHYQSLAIVSHQQNWYQSQFKKLKVDENLNYTPKSAHFPVHVSNAEQDGWEDNDFFFYFT